MDGGEEEFTPEEDKAMLEYLQEKAGTARTPTKGMEKFWKEYVKHMGDRNRRSAKSIQKRFRNDLSENLHRMKELDFETRIRMIYFSRTRLEQEFVEELRARGAEVRVTELRYLREYRDKGVLELPREPETVPKIEDFTKLEDWDMFEHLCDAANAAKEPLSMHTVWKEFWRKTNSRHSVNAIETRFRVLMAPKLDVLPMADDTIETRIKIFYFTRTPVTQRFFDDLEEGGDVELDENRCILKFRSGSFVLGDFDEQNERPFSEAEDKEMLDFLLGMAENEEWPVKQMDVWRKFKSVSGSDRRDYVIRNHFTQALTPKLVDQLDGDARIKVLFAMKVPINEDFANELRQEAELELDRKRQIVWYKGKGLELESDERPHKKRVREEEFPDSESENEDGEGEECFTAQEDAEMIQFLVEKTKNTKQLLSPRQLWEEFVDSNGSTRTFSAVRARLRHLIFEFVHENQELHLVTKVIMLMMYRVPIDRDLLKRLKHNASVKVSEDWRIVQFKEYRDGAVNLRVEDELKRDKAAMLEFLVDQAQAPNYPLSLDNFFVECKRVMNTERSLRSLSQLFHRYLRPILNRLEEFPLATRIGMLYITETPVDESFEEELRQRAELILDGQRCILKYKEHDGVLEIPLTVKEKEPEPAPETTDFRMFRSMEKLFEKQNTVIAKLLEKKCVPMEAMTSKKKFLTAFQKLLDEICTPALAELRQKVGAQIRRLEGQDEKVPAKTSEVKWGNEKQGKLEEQVSKLEGEMGKLSEALRVSELKLRELEFEHFSSPITPKVQAQVQVDGSEKKPDNVPKDESNEPKVDDVVMSDGDTVEKDEDIVMEDRDQS
ncbi:unnamed protein product [Caenorhabditis sp. 36 PRJEB53466]|nr:unnamed protein product [Caenorhabditis sp. 36 PRJEB53466]